MGHEIYVFDFNCNLKQQKWLMPLINSEKIKRIFVKNLCKEQGKAIDQTEIIYSNLKNQKLSQIITSLYGTEQVSSIFKRELIREIFKCIYINNYFKKNEKRLEGRIYFVPEKFNIYKNLIMKYGDYTLTEFNRIRIYKWSMPILPLILLQEKSRYYFATILFVGIKALLLAFGKLKNQKKATPVHFKYMIPLDQNFLIKFEGSRRFDFLLNDKEIIRENTVFFVTFAVGNDWLMRHRRKGYNIIEGKDIYGFHKLLNINCNYLFVKSALKAVFKMFWCWHNLTPYLRAFFICIRTFVNWQLIFRQVSFEKYIYTNNESERQLAINILIRNNKAKTYDYSSFIGGPYLRAMGEDYFVDLRHPSRSYMNADYFLAMNEDTVKYYKLHHQTIGEYCIIGCIYSEMVKSVEAVFNKEKMLLEYFNKTKEFKNKKIISFFDTSFIDSPDSPSTFEDCIGFYQDIIKLLDSRRDILVIIKPSKNEEWFITPSHQWSSIRGYKIIELWNILKKNSNVCWAGDSGDIPAIMAVSDLVITFCMSSPTAEALGARKRAIWYESGNKHRGLLYDQIPGLIVHGYNDLEEGVDYLLHKVTDEEYNRYLEQNIKGKVESYLDGKALTRFRNLLVGAG